MLLDRLRKITNLMIGSNPPQIQTRHFPDTGLQIFEAVMAVNM
jgi:hypothetical protein